MTAPRQQLHEQAATHAPPDTLNSRHGVSAHAPATVEADGVAEFVAPALGIQHGPAPEHSSKKPAGPGPAGGTHDDTLPKRALISSTRTDSGQSECQTPIAPTQRPSAARTDAAADAARAALHGTDGAAGGAHGADGPADAGPVIVQGTDGVAGGAKVRRVERYEDILEELYVAVRLREAPLPRGQKLQSSWD